MTVMYLLCTAQNTHLLIWAPVIVAIFAIFIQIILNGFQIKESKKITNVQIMNIYVQQFEDEKMIKVRGNLAKTLLKRGTISDDKLYDEINDTLLNFITTIAILVNGKYFDAKLAWHNFGYYSIRYYESLKWYIELIKIKEDDDTLYRSLKTFVDKMYEIEKRERPLKNVYPNQKDIMSFLENEVIEAANVV